MNSHQINKLLQHKISFYKGTYLSDKLPQDFTRPALFVVNLDPHTKPGSHWVVLYFSKFGEYFGTYARRLSLAMTRLMNKHSRRRTYNRKRLQAIASGVCNLYCCHLAVAEVTGWSLRKFADLFSVTDLCKNDRLAVTLFKRPFGSCPRCTRRGVQTCVPALDIKEEWVFTELAIVFIDEKQSSCYQFNKTTGLCYSKLARILKQNLDKAVTHYAYSKQIGNVLSRLTGWTFIPPREE
uniref:Uncharacterized protein n=1 Tax=Timema poppense TaxID=170557 RepID=A0A7R9DLS0_TIMPO|nr:unnamed protein product [Timema poppensis]